MKILANKNKYNEIGFIDVELEIETFIDLPDNIMPLAASKKVNNINTILVSDSDVINKINDIENACKVESQKLVRSVFDKMEDIITHKFHLRILKEFEDTSKHGSIYGGCLTGLDFADVIRYRASTHLDSFDREKIDRNFIRNALNYIAATEPKRYNRLSRQIFIPPRLELVSVIVNGTYFELIDAAISEFEQLIEYLMKNN